MIKQELTQHIHAPLEKVFALVTDFRRNKEWQNGVIESSQTPDGPTGPGTKFKTVRTFLGQRIEATGEVTEFVANQKFGFKSTSGPMQFSLSQSFAAAEGGTTMHLVVEMEGAGFFKIAEGALGKNIAKEFEAQAEKLKALLER
jgi:uncharacterized protein YndB with AHSA1/START domain